MISEFSWQRPGLVAGSLYVHMPARAGHKDIEPESDSHGQEQSVIILGIILLIIGILVGISVLTTIGGVLIVVGAILWILGATGRAIGGRKHYF